MRLRGWRARVRTLAIRLSSVSDLDRMSQSHLCRFLRAGTHLALTAVFVFVISVSSARSQDLDNVTVRCVYGDKSEEKTIYLQKDESANRVLLTSAQFSQEADLGTRATYDMTLELFSSMDNVYKLALLNLPRQIAYDFLEDQTSARLSQVKFSQDVNTRKLSLAVYLPDRYDSSSFLIDKAGRVVWGFEHDAPSASRVEALLEE